MGREEDVRRWTSSLTYPILAREWSSQTDWLCLMDWNSIVHTLLWGFNLRNLSFPLTLGLYRKKGLHTFMMVQNTPRLFFRATVETSERSTMTQSFVSGPATKPNTESDMIFPQICWGQICNLATSHQWRCQASNSFAKRSVHNNYRQPYWPDGYGM